jgi:hypothetical protein
MISSSNEICDRETGKTESDLANLFDWERILLNLFIVFGVRT